MKSKTLPVFLVLFLLLAAGARQSFSDTSSSTSGFDSSTDVDWDEINFTIDGICECDDPYDPVGIQYEYWEPFLVIDTSATPYYSAYLGRSLKSSSGSSSGDTADSLWDDSSTSYTSNLGSGSLSTSSLTNGGKNKSQDTIDNGESTFAQAHGWLIPILPLCSRSDYGMWWSEYDSMWQSDTLTAIIEPEAALFANEISQLACMADATAANLGFPLDELFWCVGSGGSAYPLTGHVADDSTVQANSTIASRLIYLLNRLFMICDPAEAGGCGCSYTPIWVKSHYKMAVRRPGAAKVYALGRSATLYGSGINIPYRGVKGPNDQFMWVVYRKKICCTCCD